MKAYLQFDDGFEVDLDVTEPDPPDGSFCVHFNDYDVPAVDTSRWWIRICPTEPTRS